jgi:hypothetical protein
MSRLFSFVLASLFFLGVTCGAGSVSTFAQTAGTGALTGVVTDASGAVVAGAEIKVTSEATGEVRSVVSATNGNYSVPLLLPGLYRVEISKAGFKTSSNEHLRITVTETVALNVKLVIGPVAETMVVEANAEVLQTESSTLGRVTTGEQVRDLPLVSRNYTQIVTLSPGIAANVTNAYELGRGTGGESGGQFRAHGAFGADNNFQMNGLQINDLQASGSFSGGIAVPSPDAIQEFKVQTGQYDASYGRNAGANVDLVTKIGGNQFHGTVFEFFRNNDLNANSFFSNKAGQPRGVLKQNQFGGTLGGPIVKEKLLFFFSYQGTRQINGIAPGSTASLITPPFTNDRSAEALGTMFNGRCVAGLPPGACTAFGLATIQGPASPGAPCPVVNGRPCNISPQALALFNQKFPNGGFVIPNPQTTDLTKPIDTRGFSAFSVPGTFNENQYVGNVDFLHTSKSRISGRFFTAHSDLLEPIPPSQLGSAAPGFPYLIPNTFRSASLTHLYTFSSTLLNQAEFGFNRVDVGNNQQEAFKFSDIGVTAPPVANRFPVIGVNGSLSLGGNGQSVRVVQNHYNIQDSLTYIRGRQTFRFGGGFTHSALDLKNFTFFGGILFLSWPDFLLGLPAGPTASGGNGTPVPGVLPPLSNVFLSFDIPGDLDRSWIVKDGNAYVQDDIKLTRSFTLNLGVRYERLGHLADTGGRNAGFDIALANPNPPPGGTFAGYLVSSNYPGTPQAGVTQLDNRFGNHGNGQNDFGPRAGFAWKLPKTFLAVTDRMVLRGGYGIYYTRATGQAFLQLAAGQPFADLRLVQGVPNSAATFANPFQPQPVLPQFTAYSPATRLSTTLVDPAYRPPITQEYSLNTQTDLGHNFVLEVGYAGARGTHLIYGHTLNQAMLASPSNPIRGLTTNTVANISQRVPILGFLPGGLGDVDSSANSWYNGLEASITKRLSRGLQFLASYTFAHSYSDSVAGTGATGTGIGSGGNQANRSANYGRTDFNREQRFVFSYVYDLPSPKEFGFVNKALGGWSVAGVTTIQSGLPLTLTGTSLTNAFLGAVTDRVQLAPGCTNLGTSGSVEKRLSNYFNAACISPSWPVIGSDGLATAFGNSGVGIISGPGQNNYDIAIIKRTSLRSLGERGNVEFRTEFFNAFNHPQFGNPGTSFGTPTFGVISTTSTNARIMQFALKLNF